MTDTGELVRRLCDPGKFGAAADYATMREAAATIERLAATPAKPDRKCTCHPDDDPPVPCAGKYALSECKAPSPTDDEQVMLDVASDIVEMCRDEKKVGLFELSDAEAVQNVVSAMRAYVARIRAEERERCAKIAEATYTVDGNDSMSEVDRWVAGNGIAAAIRTGEK